MDRALSKHFNFGEASRSKADFISLAVALEGDMVVAYGNLLRGIDNCLGASYKGLRVFWTSFSKVEKIVKDSLDSISPPSPSVKIQIMGGKVCLRCKGKTLLGINQQCFVLLPQVKYPANNLNFH